jgi:NAD(P)-dependent dehydrogenase (short-subunit alcohol dehydrogenase family)
VGERTLLVFGARNLGRALCAAVTADGWRAAAVARSEETIESLARELPDVAGIVADAVSPEEAERAFAEAQVRLGRLDLVVNAVTPRPRSGLGGGSIVDAPPDALESYVNDLLPAIFNVIRIGSRILAEQGRGTFVQVTGGSARRGMPGRGPWAAGAFATRALSQSAALELREKGVHLALLIVDATIESEKTAQMLAGRPPESSASQDDVVAAIRYLADQSPRGWTHELQITPSGDRWVP